MKALQTGADPVPAAKAGGLIARVSRFLIANWVLFSFVAALCTAAYVKFAFGVDYFRDYRNIQAKNNLTAFYTHMGDVLMGRAEWLAAEEAYRNALQIDPRLLQRMTSLRIEPFDRGDLGVGDAAHRRDA